MRHLMLCTESDGLVSKFECVDGCERQILFNHRDVTLTVLKHGKSSIPHSGTTSSMVLIDAAVLP